jgi:hypothetical protein
MIVAPAKRARFAHAEDGTACLASYTGLIVLATTSPIICPARTIDRYTAIMSDAGWR